MTSLEKIKMLRLRIMVWPIPWNQTQTKSH